MAAGTILLAFPGTRILRQTPDILRSLLANATAEDLDWQPGNPCPIAGQSTWCWRTLPPSKSRAL